MLQELGIIGHLGSSPIARDFRVSEVVSRWRLASSEEMSDANEMQTDDNLRDCQAELRR
jgi:hypothetical protein